MIFHICKKEVWAKEKDNIYFGEEEIRRYGFIRSSTEEGLKKILDRFTDPKDHIILSIDEGPIRDRIVYEEKDEEKLYPHFYEKIPASSTVKAEALNVFLFFKSKEKKIVLTDIDGTVCDYESRIAMSTKEALRKARENGHLVYMVTGRSKAENRQEIWDLGFDGMIGGNGAYIEDHGEVVFHKHLSYEECRHIVDWCEERGLGLYEESNNGLFGSKRFYEGDGAAALRSYMKGKGEDEEDKTDEEVLSILHGLVRSEDLYRNDVNKISFVLHSYEDLLAAKEEFKDLKVGSWGGKDQEALFGDVGIPTSNKADAIGLLLDHLKTNRKNTLALGDADVDIPMLQYCGIGVAMGSGSEGIKDVADYVTDDVDKDGYYKAFEHFRLI